MILDFADIQGRDLRRDRIELLDGQVHCGRVDNLPPQGISAWRPRRLDPPNVEIIPRDCWPCSILEAACASARIVAFRDSAWQHRAALRRRP
jgi:hypothetical protein